MAEQRNFVELRSDEVQEILGTPPNWLVRWGTTVAFLGFMVLLGAAWFVRYPDVVISDKLSVTTADPPVEVVARTDGRVSQLLVKDTTIVTERQPLAVLQNTARYADVHLLDALVAQWLSLKPDEFRQLVYPDSLSLGELQADYAVFVRDLEDFKFGRENRNTSVRLNISAIQLQIKQLEQGIAYEQAAQKRTNEQWKIAAARHEKQRDLMKQGVVAPAEFEKEGLVVSELERQRDAHEGIILEKNREIISLKSSINAANFGQQENSTTSSTRLLASLNALRSAIDKWVQTYIVSAPIAGQVALNGLTTQQFVRQGESVMTIVPQNQDEIVGHVLLPVEKSGKVAVGQRVILKLDNYPYQEFGTVSGKVASKSPVPKNREYTILVNSLSHNTKGKLLTSSNKEIPFEQQMLGRAEIVTADKGFLERVIEQVVSGLK